MEYGVYTRQKWEYNFDILVKKNSLKAKKTAAIKIVNVMYVVSNNISYVCFSSFLLYHAHFGCILQRISKLQ